MKYFRIFDYISSYTEYMVSESAITPNVSYCYEDDMTFINPHVAPTRDYSREYFTIESLEDNNVIKVNRGSQYSGEQYSVDGGKTWSNTTSGDGEFVIATINKGDKLMLKSSKARWSSSWSTCNSLGATKDFIVYGNIMSLTWEDEFIGKTEFKPVVYSDNYNNIFASLFRYKGTTSPTLKSAENLILPATRLCQECYNGMFRDCTGLEYPPQLPATTLTDACYSSMFECCTSLKVAPELPATALTFNCYNRMFCMNRNGGGMVTAALTTAPVLPAKTLAEQCYLQMFEGNGNLTYIEMLATDMSAPGCTDNWVRNVGSTGTFVKDSTMTIEVGRHGIPNGWTVVNKTTFELSIEGASSISAESCSYNAIVDNVTDVTSSATWSIVSGSQYATINSNNGEITILSNANNSTVVIQAVYQGSTATKEITLTYVSGATSETETETTTDASGNTTTVVTTITTNEDGSSSEISETVITDASGNTIGTSESNKDTNADGSYSGNTTNFDANGNPTDAVNVSGDTDGNVSTQGIEYDESGNTVVTGYTIDTSESQSGYKTFNGDGINTDYYAFDVTHGFVLDFSFTIDCSNKPSGQNENHHTALAAKRATPEPWYGFQLRQSSTNKYIQLGTQFSTGGNVNTKIDPSTLSGSIASYNLRITYNPIATANTFVCTDMDSNTVVYSSNGLFPDIQELRDLKITIGYSVDGNGNAFRYSDINVLNFSIRKVSNVAEPIISCDGEEVSISCSTVGATVYYRLNESGDYSAYTSAFAITADTVVETYAELDGVTSTIAKQTCSYIGGGVSDPIISCDGTYVTITCDTSGADIYYRLNQSGSYSAYTASFAITADTVVQAYATRGAVSSNTVTETCTYVVDYSEMYFTIQSLADNNSITINRGGNTDITVSASTDDGATWSIVYNKGVTGLATIGTLNNGDKLLLKATGGNRWGHNTDSKCISLDASQNYVVYGNINSLLNGDNFQTNLQSLAGNTFKRLFSYSGNGSSTLISAENLVLLSSFVNNPTYEYAQMFLNCTNLTKAPTIANDSLNSNTCKEMYKGCSSLSEIRIASTNISASDCLKNWVQGVSASGTFYKKQATVFPSGVNGVPSGWSTQNID